MIACVVMVVLGAGIFIDKPIQIDMTDKPIWLGYFLVYGGLFLMIMCVVNEVVGIFKYRKILGLFQSIKNKNSLKTRIEKEGQKSDIKTSANT